MLTAVFEESNTFRKIVDSIKELVPQVNFQASPNGISLQAMDSAHVSLVAMNLGADSFKKYRCDQEFVLGINLNDLSKILKMASNDDQLSILANSQESYLTIHFENSKKDQESKCQLNLLSIENDNLNIPETEYPTVVGMSSSSFFKICKDFTSFSEVLQLDIKEKSASFKYTGKNGSGEKKFKNNKGDSDEDTFEIKCQEEISSKF